MLKIDLIPEDEGEKRKKKLRNISIFVLVLIVLLGGGAYFSFSFLQKREDVKLSGLKSQIEGVNQEIKNSEDELTQALIAQKQLDSLDRLLNRRMYWVAFFQTLGHVTIPDVFYTSFKGDIDSRKISLPAYTRNYQSLARQLKAWEQQQAIEKLEVASASLDVTEDQAVISFQADLTFKEEAWQK